ncbi:MAG: LeuA family protein [Microcoleaceae cyanobacterium]
MIGETRVKGAPPPSWGHSPQTPLLDFIEFMAAMTSNQRSVHLIDQTLREGRQSPGVKLEIDQALEIAQRLAALPVEQIECGHPAAGPDDMELVQKIVALGLSCPILAHSRSCREDIDATVLSGVQWVGLFLGINDVTQRTRVVGWSVQKILDRITDSVTYARQQGLQVRYTLEDASRTDAGLMIQAFSAAVAAGADRICFSDTLGILKPERTTAIVQTIKQVFPNTDLEVHLHNDRGLAIANALAAIDAGANWISTSVNGLGERVGITDLCQLMANLHYEGLRTLTPGNQLRQLSNCVATYTRTPVADTQPVMGQHAFTHRSVLHARATRRDEMAYNWLNPALVGGETQIAAELLPDLSQLVVKPIFSTEINFQLVPQNVGQSYLMMGHELVSDCRQTCIVQEISPLSSPQVAVKTAQVRPIDSLMLALGNELNLTGLTVEVSLNGVIQTVQSPASIFIPAGIPHSYRVISGRGTLVHHIATRSHPSNQSSTPAELTSFRENPAENSFLNQNLLVIQ